MTDSSGNTVAQYTYDAWGNPLSSSGALASVNPIRYAGYRWDDAVGMYYLNARYYRPDLMRFISRDPVDGVNLYTYCSDNPINRVDPTGEFWWLVASALVGAAIDAGTYVYEHRNGGFSWAGLAEHAAIGAISGVAMGGFGKVAEFGLTYATMSITKHAAEQMADRAVSRFTVAKVVTFGAKRIDTRHNDRAVRVLGRYSVVYARKGINTRVITTRYGKFSKHWKATRFYW